MCISYFLVTCWTKETFTFFINLYEIYINTFLHSYVPKEKCRQKYFVTDLKKGGGSKFVIVTSELS